MICAYDKIYLEPARQVLASMLDYAVNDCGYEINKFFDIFIASGMAGRFERGDFTILVGKSGVEVAREVIEKKLLDVSDNENLDKTITIEHIKPRYTLNKSEEYWTGNVLAYYQWISNLSFKEIIEVIPIEDIQKLYYPYHEMDIRQFVDAMQRLYREYKPETNLKIMREKSKLSQGELAVLADIPVRTIQQYEQRRKNINKTSLEYAYKLAKVLKCDIGDLIEHNCE